MPADGSVDTWLCAVAFGVCDDSAGAQFASPSGSQPLRGARGAHFGVDTEDPVDFAARQATNFRGGLYGPPPSGSPTGRSSAGSGGGRPGATQAEMAQIAALAQQVQSMKASYAADLRAEGLGGGGSAGSSLGRGKAGASIASKWAAKHPAFAGAEYDGYDDVGFGPGGGRRR
jgi:hypothetical protein